jgi:2-amino-4-hydroxy-6-hydroxymethyldihydropteridine diphosphokinase
MLSLGSNIGPRKRRLRDAARSIAQNILSDVQCSSIYETDPVGFTEQDPFLNVVLVGQTTLSPTDLHEACKGLEVAQGRQHRERWREREIDIDVIFYGDEIVSSDNLQIPHAHVQERRFVLQPAVEVAPKLVDPGSGCTMEELLAICLDHSGVRMVQPPIEFSS